jgi:serine O-acetyltransferase
LSYRDFTTRTRADFFRCTGSTSCRSLLREVVLGETYQYLFWFRLCQWLRQQPLLRLTLYPFAHFFWRRYTYRYGIDIPLATRIGPGLYLPHFGNIVVHNEVIIGADCTISHGVTLGRTNRGLQRGCPTMGDRIFVGPGAKIIGGIRIGSDVAVGANAVVTHDVPDNAVVAGVPARVVSMQGSAEYIVRPAAQPRP